MTPFTPLLDQERGEFDSASKAELARLCGGRFNLVRKLRAAGDTFEEDSSEAAIAGDLIHAKLLGLEVELPSKRAAETCDTCASLRAKIVSSFTGGELGWEIFAEYWQTRTFGRYQVLREVRLWYRVGLAKLFSGQADLIVIDLEEARALIVDYKSGIKDVPEPARNEQLRALVVLLKHNIPELNSIACEVIQPWVSWQGRAAEYVLEDMAAAERDTAAGVYARNLYETSRTAGLHCGRCEARARCADAIRWASSVSNMAQEIEAGRLELPIGEEGDKALDRLDTVEKIFRAVRARYKAELIKDPAFLPGRKIAPGVRSLTSVAGAWQIVKNYLERPQFDEACTVQITELENALSEKLGWRAKQKTEKFNELFGDILKHGEPRMLVLSAKDKKARALAAAAPAPETAEESSTP